MARTSSLLARFRAVCLALPDTKETPTWGTPHFRVRDKIFAGFGEEHGKTSVGFKLEMDHARAILRDARFSPAPYVGHKGWVSMDLSGGVEDWDEVRDLVLESYELIAPRKSFAKLDGGSARILGPKEPAARKRSPKSRGSKATPRKRTAKRRAK
jgi:predicted DNA-binding protein (MmcQ/YjbR family)